MIASQYNDKAILQITYNSQLKLEVRNKAQELQLTNLEVHSYHSLAVKNYNNTAYNDCELTKIVNNDIPLISNKNNFDIIIIDEIQDMTTLYYVFLKKFLKDVYLNNMNQMNPQSKSHANIIRSHATSNSIQNMYEQQVKFPQLILMGDKNQCIYEFKSADRRFLTLGDKIWFPQLNKSYIFSELYLNITYRVTYEIAEFVNKNMLHYKRLIAKKHGPPVEYIRCNQHAVNKMLAQKIKQYGYKSDDIFVLAPSIKTTAPCRLLENKMVELGYKCYASLSEDSKIDSSVIEGKEIGRAHV